MNKLAGAFAEPVERSFARPVGFDAPNPFHFSTGTKVFVGLLVGGLLLFVILKTSGALDSSGDGEKSGESPLAAGSTPTRACMITERQCPGEKNCRAANGGLTGAAAMTSDGHKCCTYRCEDDYIDIRPCKSTEKTCDRQQACRMGNTVQMPEAITASGLSCCKFDCDTGDIPTRACFPGSETVCPPNSYCYDFNGNVTVPKARMSNGNSCCGYTGQGNPTCVPING